MRLNAQGSLPLITQGVVDCVYTFACEGRIPETLTPYTVDVPSEEERDGKITLMPAGNVVASAYWKRLGELNWHDLFYTEGSKGLLFFLELKERIRAEFKPDFLLIDARTGITEIGGVATTLLADQVVCLLLNNRENLEGAREVIRGINRVSAQRKKPIGIVPVLARLPAGVRSSGPAIEGQLAERVHAFLSEDENGDRREGMAELPPVSVLHADESLAYQESLRIGDNRDVDESPLLRDYLRLFARIIPNDGVEPHLDRLVGTRDEGSAGEARPGSKRSGGVDGLLPTSYVVPGPAEVLPAPERAAAENSAHGRTVLGTVTADGPTASRNRVGVFQARTLPPC